MRRLATIVLVTALAAATSAVVAPTAPSASLDEPSAGVTGVRVTDPELEVVGLAAPRQEVDIYALGTHEEPGAWEHSAPIATVPAGEDGTFEVTVDLGADVASDHHLYYAKYLAVVDDEPVGVVRYVDDNQITATNQHPYPEPATKKGLQVQMTADAEELGVGHAAINVAFDQLLRRGPDGEETIRFTSGGREFHANRSYVEHLDRVIAAASDNEMAVNLVLILYQNDHPNSAFPELVHPDWDPEGTVFAFDTVTAEGVAHYTAAIEFIADRWSREDARHGQAVGFIVGNEIDAQWVWSNMGEAPLDDFVRAYERALRLTHQAVAAAYADGRVYTSLTHSWTLPSGPEEPPDRYYPGRDVLDALNEQSKAHGDYDWHVAHHPYPEDLNDPAFWNDETATDDVETTGRITFKNIELLDDYLRRDELTYQGEPRRILLSEQGCNTPGDTLEDEQLQAACYALAYYKIHFLDAIDAFILHRHVDFKTEFGLRLGLWTWDDDRPEQSAPDEQKVIYDVFRDIDTDRSLEATEFALDVIGIDDWAEMVDGWNPDALAVREPPGVGGTSVTARPRQGSVLFDFADGDQGWRPADAAMAVGVDDGHLRTEFQFEPSLAAQLAKLWRGSAVTFDEPVDATDTPYLSARIRVPDEPELGARQARLKAYAGDGSVHQGTARLAPGDDWQPVTVDLSAWSSRDDLVRLKVWVRGSTSEAWSGSFDLDEVTLASQLVGQQRAVNLDIEAEAPQRLEAGAPVILTVTNDDLAAAHGALRLEACGGVEVAPPAVPLRRLPPGEQLEVETHVVAADPDDARTPHLCARIHGRSFEVPIELPPPTPTVIHDFDDGTSQGWQAGDGLVSVDAVTSIANAPAAPHAGTHALEGISDAAPGDAQRRFLLEPDEPLDLSDAAEVSVFVNSYGGAPEATGYEVELTLHADEDTVSTTIPYEPDRWSEVVVDVHDWPGRAAVDRVEVAFRAVGDDDLPDWSPRFQLDTFRWLDAPRA